MKRFLYMFFFLVPMISNGQWIFIQQIPTSWAAFIANDGTTYSFNNVYKGEPALGTDYALLRNDTVILEGNLAYNYGDAIQKVFFVGRDTGFLLTGNSWATSSRVSQTNNAGNSWLSPSCPIDVVYGYFDFMYIRDPGGSLYGFRCDANGYYNTAEIQTCVDGKKFDTTITSYATWGQARIFFMNKDTGFYYTYDSLLRHIIMRTSDGGRSWSTVLADQHFTFWNIAFTSRNNGFMVGNSGVLYKTNDSGVTWERSIIDSTLTLYDLSFLNDSIGYICGSKGHLFYTHDAANTWTPLPFPDSNDVYHVRFLNHSVGFAISGGKLYKTTTGGFLGINDYPALSIKTALFFPNPVKKIASILIPSEFVNESDLQLVVMNVYGQYLNNVIERVSKEYLNINLSRIPSGLYFGKLSNGESYYNVRFIKE